MDFNQRKNQYDENNNNNNDWDSAAVVGKETPSKEILYEGNYYDVTKFIERHPGGREIISYFTKPGEDATAAIQQFHKRALPKVHGIMKALKHRQTSDIQDNHEDELTKKKNRALTEDFTKLYLELKAEGLFEPSFPHVAYRMAEMGVYALLGFYLITQYTSTWIKFFGCLMLSTGTGRAAWIMHEAGHISLTGSPKIDRIIQSMVLGVMTGLSGIWWRRHHSLHHAMTQRLRHDVDLDLLPLFLVHIEVLNDPLKEQTFSLRNQILLAPFSGLVAIFYVVFWETGRCLVKYKIWYEFLAVGIHYVVAYQIGFWPWVASDTMVIIYSVMNFGLSHSHLPVTDKPTHWVEYALAHTADVEQRPWCDWWMGFLNYQIEHHLFPTMPQFRNKLAVERVKALAQKHGLPYYVFSYKEALIKMIKNVFDVSQDLKKLAKQKSSCE